MDEASCYHAPPIPKKDYRAGRFDCHLSIDSSVDRSLQGAGVTPNMRADGIMDLPSKYSVADTIDRLEALLKSKGIKIFARIDQAAEAKAVDLFLRPTVLLIFGDPRAGTPLMDRYPSLALDLPLKAVAWESADGKVWLSYNPPEYFMERHHLDSPPFKAVEQLIGAAVQ